MDKKIEEIFKCLPCQATTDSLHKGAIKVSELPSGPWEQLSLDFWGHTNSGEYIFVLIDNYSQFHEIEMLVQHQQNQQYINQIKYCHP